MAIITKIVNGKKYLYEVKAYRKNGKVKHEWKSLGHYDENGNFIPSKKMRGKKPEDFPAEIQKVTTTTTKIRVVEKKEKAEPIEPEIINDVCTTDKEKSTATNEKALAKITPKSSLSLVFNGMATNALGIAKTRGEFDLATRILKVKGVNIFSPESVQKVGVGTAKIFRYAVAEFTKRNHQNATGDKINYRIFLDVKDFAKANEIDINSESAMKNFRFKLSKSLETLRYSGISWTEKVKGQPRSYTGMNYIGKYELKTNSLMIEFTISMAEYLTSLPLINYPRALYKVDDRDFNAFAIGEAMCIHYGQDNNVIRQTEGKLRVETLLKYTSFPDYDTLKEQGWAWEAHVKELFENALDHLTQNGFLKEWKYCYEGGIEITDEEIKTGIIDSYEKFISLIVKFELNDYEDSKMRAIEISKKKAEKIKTLQIKKKRNEQ